MDLRLIIFGPPGAGKGTQAQMIAGRLGVPQIATGDILREALKQGTELGKKAEVYMKQGLLVPDEVIIGIVENRLNQPDCGKGFVLDGFPRTLPQAKALEETLMRLDAPLDAVINLKILDEEVVKRISQRRSCSMCGAIYHLISKPPRRREVCDLCSGDLYQRADDSEETVKNRLKVYNSQTEPLIRYYREKGLLKEVDGAQPIEKVTKAIWNVISSLAEAKRLRAKVQPDA